LLLLVLLVMLGDVSCSSSSADEAPPRPQLIVVVDTDTALVGQLANQTAISPALAIDTVRVDVVADDREVKDYRDFTAPDLIDWPLSFGIAATGRTRLRLRAFRASLATAGTLGALTTIEPPPYLAIDRIVELPELRPTDGVRTVRVLLAAACFGAPVSFQSPLRTCIDATKRLADPSENVIEGPRIPSLAGTASAEIMEKRCANPPRTSAVCVPGGPTILGDPHLTSLIEGPQPGPARAVLLSPFQMDKTEFTVGRYRTLLATKAVTEVPKLQDPNDFLRKLCTWQGPTSSAADKLPLNCITFPAALRACEAEGGTLPTEAQWEHAARGRRGFAFPWGDTDPQCCTASISRLTEGGIGECEGDGAEPVNSHVGTQCTPEDVTFDGVVDLAGSVKEMLLDGGMPYSDPCWSAPGLVLDPKCAHPQLQPGRMGRGADFSAGMYLLHSALRPTGSENGPTQGFRCVYKDGR
jgi:formylglycine-generating enzyme required for sulfatase activity